MHGIRRYLNQSLFYNYLQPIDLIVVEFEVEFGYPGPKSPPSTLVDNILKTYKASLEFTATIPSSGKNFRNLL